jgi:hypothetical protein
MAQATVGLKLGHARLQSRQLHHHRRIAARLAPVALTIGALAFGVGLGHGWFPVTRNRSQTQGREGMQRIMRDTCQPHRTICYGMANLYAHDPDCDFWFDHYESEYTCGRPGLKPAQDLRAIWDEIAELMRRIEQLEARVAASVTQ